MKSVCLHTGKFIPLGWFTPRWDEALSSLPARCLSFNLPRSTGLCKAGDELLLLHVSAGLQKEGCLPGFWVLSLAAVSWHYAGWAVSFPSAHPSLKGTGFPGQPDEILRCWLAGMPVAVLVRCGCVEPDSQLL